MGFSTDGPIRNRTLPFWYTRRPPAKGGSASSFAWDVSDVEALEVAHSFFLPTQRGGADMMPKFGAFFFDEVFFCSVSGATDTASVCALKRLTAVFQPARPTIQPSTNARTMTTQLSTVVQYSRRVAASVSNRSL